jgi:hypothetical protein
MKNLRNFWSFSIAPMTLILVLAIAASAQSAGTTRPNPIETMRTINDETYRELTNITRETKIRGADNSEAGRAARLKQIRDDFKSIQSVNNKMMAEAWQNNAIDYARTSAMIADINAKASRLKINLALPEAGKLKRKNLTATGTKEFKSALLQMDHSLMSFVTNPIFQEQKVMEVGLATRASQDLESVIIFSADLKRLADNLKNSRSNK